MTTPSSIRPTPCPCGSRREQAECCPPPEAGPGGAAPVLAERGLVEFLWRWARHRFGEAFDPHRDYPGAIGCGDCDALLRTPWGAYDYAVEGRRVAAWFAHEYAELLGAPTARWLAGVQTGWLSIWAVLDCRPGRTLELQDCLSGARHVAVERWQSTWVRPGDYLCLRLVDAERAGVTRARRQGADAVVAAQHAMAGSAPAAAMALDAVRAQLGIPTSRIGRSVLRTPEGAAAVIRGWEAPLAGAVQITLRRTPDSRDRESA